MIRYFCKSQSKAAVSKTEVLVFIQFCVFLIAVILSSCASASPSMEAPMARDSVLGYRSSEVSIDERMVTYSVTLGLSVRNTEETRSILIEQVRNNDGFIVRESDNSITTRIPSGNMDNFINHARTLGNIESESKTGTDITDQYRDNVIRLDSLKNVRNRYLTLLERADTVADILSIEKELERVNTEIELLEGRIRHAELSVTYSNITVRFREKTKPGPVGWVFVGLYHGIRWLFVWN